MQKIQITTDSTCDLTQELIEKYNLKSLPLAVITDDEHLDGVDYFPTDIFEYVKQTKKLPKTAARSVADYEEFFKPFVDAGTDVVHIGIGSKLSSSYENACAAAKNMGNDHIFVVDSNSLSTGTGLLVISGAEMVAAGKTAEQIANKLAERAAFVEASFVVDRLDYLYKGGRCSALAMLGANLLKIKPRLQVVDGKIINSGKYFGKLVPVLKKYIDETLRDYPNMDKKRCFVTHAHLDDESVAEIVEYVKAKNIFGEVLVTTAGSVITSHCGQNTLGILYINDGDKK